ncbi:VOC family protein [Streptomyces sp. LP05-1]|uniref:VOC family protein n=1 Tax=Streptomyces pyxinae TaxID=2970734 RepID=A0ABT2CEQ0_9ACTN|nr:VOC family protein [Streptomyces sp. LP05-1]MCS0635889.1 VOC family protein [Streptomyces sp. LP05-1]
MSAFTEGTPCWADVLLPDLEAGKRFYGGLFGWTFPGDRRPGTETPVEPGTGKGTGTGAGGTSGASGAKTGGAAGAAYGRYADAYSDGRRVAALAAKRDGRMPTAWGVYFATPDAVALTARIKDAGGRMVTDPVAFADRGVLAVAADPGGAVFGLWQAGALSGFEKQGVPGSFCWTEVYTRAKDAVDSFYEAVFGFQVRDLEDDPAVDFRVWSPAGTRASDETAVGGRSVITDAFPAEMPAHFLTYFAVEDCDDTAAGAERLGGRVTEPPFDTPYGRIAVIADDQGAVFAVLAEPHAA